MKSKKKKMATCPECGEKFELENYLEDGDIADCPHCFADLRVVSLVPLKLESAGGVLDEADDLEEEEDLEEESDNAVLDEDDALDDVFDEDYDEGDGLGELDEEDQDREEDSSRF
ncbi:MAG: hypothetical protein NC924_09955 [Candidatus Omnitrophica bacterium]|nr:hypothetical protein [Candidatus Omnitrophota bacterium]